MVDMSHKKQPLEFTSQIHIQIHPCVLDEIHLSRGDEIWVCLAPQLCRRPPKPRARAPRRGKSYQSWCEEIYINLKL